MKRLVFGILMIVCSLSRPAAAADREQLEYLLREIPAQSLRPVSVGQTAVWLLKGIHAVDPALQVANDADKVTLYYHTRPVKSLYKPEKDEDIGAWTDLGEEIIDLAVEKSAKAQKYDFEMIDKMAAAGIAQLDRDGKYFAFDQANGRKGRRYRDKFAARLENDLLYIKLGAFNAATRGQLEDALIEFSSAPGLILDLRGSPGGLLSEAVDIADLFLEEGIIVTVKSRGDTVYYSAKEKDVWAGKPMVLLVDSQTASSAEALAAALQEQGRAPVVGTASFGKGTLQNLLQIPGGGTLAVTHALMQAPSGRNLNGRGVLPDYCTFEMPESKNPENLIKMGKDRPCPQENREDRSLDIAVAEVLLRR